MRKCIHKQIELAAAMWRLTEIKGGEKGGEGERARDVPSDTARNTKRERRVSNLQQRVGGGIARLKEACQLSMVHTGTYVRAAIVDGMCCEVDGGCPISVDGECVENNAGGLVRETLAGNTCVCAV